MRAELYVRNPRVLNLPKMNRISVSCNGSMFVIFLRPSECIKEIAQDRRTVNRPSRSIRVFLVVVSFLCDPSPSRLKKYINIDKRAFLSFYFFVLGILVFLITKTKMGLSS